jgi:hypothetical protein
VFHVRRGHEGTHWEQRYSSTLSLTSVLDGVGSKHHALATLPLRKTQHLFHRKVHGPQCQSGWVRKIYPPPPPTEFNPLNGETDVQGFKSQWEKKVFLFYKTYSLALGSTQPPTQCLKRFFLGGKAVRT